MSLATRCTACDTVFRVVQDQLKVSEGWVRCGRCQTVFSALEGLFDLTPEPAAPAAAVVSDEPAALPETVPEPPAPSRPADFDETPASRVAARDRNDFADAQFNSALLAEAGIEGVEDPPDAHPNEPPPTTEPAPEFLRQAEREAPRGMIPR